MTDAEFVRELLVERDRLRAEIGWWQACGATAHGWLDEFRPRPEADDGPDLLRLRVEACVKEVTRLRANLCNAVVALADAKRTLADLGCGAGAAMLVHTLRAELATQRAVNVRLAERLQAQAECLARAAEGDRVRQGNTGRGPG